MSVQIVMNPPSWQGRSANFKDGAVGELALDQLRLGMTGEIQPRAHLLFDVAWPIFSALRLVADETGQGGARPAQRLRKIEQLTKSEIGRDHVEARIVNTDALIHVVECALQHMLAFTRRHLGRALLRDVLVRAHCALPAID
jgi:hypothetical protein